MGKRSSPTDEVEIKDGHAITNCAPSEAVRALENASKERLLFARSSSLPADILSRLRSARPRSKAGGKGRLSWRAAHGKKDHPPV
jgi:hypothetical protein